MASKHEDVGIDVNRTPMHSQLKRGIVEMLVLKVVSDQAQSSFEVIEALSSNLSVSENTVYPILRRLRKQGYFETHSEPSPVGAPKKVYQITDRGSEKLSVFLRDWKVFLKQVLNILGGDEA